MIINKGSYDRGFKHGMIYKTKIVEAANANNRAAEQRACRFSNVMVDNLGSVQTDERGNPKRYCELTDAAGKHRLNDDGLPSIGTLIHQGDPLYCTVDHEGHPHLTFYKDEESAYVEQVNMIDGACKPAQSSRSEGPKASIKLRITRNPMVGDKFSSRHGQKGVMSILWPSEDMPFSESGITPDILFNPHGFPSRMTIGMLIESIAAKTAACEGVSTANGSTFRGYSGTFAEEGNNESDVFLKNSDGEQPMMPEGPEAAEYFGRTLKKHGFQSLGTEKMYSGIHGTEIETEIFLGVVYYQRLRHMVAEKAQVRAYGDVDKLTMQPVKGRKRGGGIRFGEMERDSLLAHGASFLLHDRLMRSSDYDIGFVCPKCGSILTPQANAKLWRKDPDSFKTFDPKGQPWECPPCSAAAGGVVRCHPMAIPWVMRYLTCEMAAMNVQMKVQVTDRAREVANAPYTVSVKGST